MSWNDTILFRGSDLQDYETEIINRIDLGAEIEKYHSMVKQEIELRLWRHFYDLDSDFSMDEDLDRLLNPEILKRASIFLALHFIFQDFVKSPEDYNDIKSQWYFQRYDVEFIRILPLIIVEFESDVSGQVIASEEYGILRRW